MAIYLVGKIWYYDITPHNGRRLRASTGTSDKAAAQEYHDRLKAQLWRKDRLGEDTSHTWDEAAALWLSEPQDESARYRLRWLTTNLQGLALNSPSFTGGFLEILISQRNSSASNYNNYVKLILAILNKARKKGWLTTVPRLEKKRVKEERIRWLSAQEWERLQKHLPAYLLQLARFTLATGLREKNVLKLEWSQVDLKRKVCWIHPDQAKARKAIGVPLNSDALRVLREQIGLSANWVFPLPVNNGGLISPSPPLRASNRAWYEALRKANLVGFRWHDLRHTWASWAVQSGVSLPELQRLGGWATPAMVMRYAHFAQEHLASAAAKVKPIRRRA